MHVFIVTRSTNSFLNNLFKKGGFVLIDANSKKYIIGSPDKSKPLTLKLLNKNLHYKLLVNPDLYFGEGYMDGSIIIENGSISEFLELAFKNIGRGEINTFGYILILFLCFFYIFYCNMISNQARIDNFL